MNRIQLACYGLIASAFILGGLLCYQIQERLPAANAEMVVHRDNFTLLTAQTRQGEEALFVLENLTGRLIVYRVDIAKERLELAGGIELSAPQFFGGNWQ